jgi:hypothetical protein
VLNTQKITHVIDNILIGLNNKKTTAELKGVFGLPNVTYDDDFASIVGSGIDAWQGKVWDPAENDPTFDLFCGNITSKSLLYPHNNDRTRIVKDLLTKGGYAAEISSLTTPFLNWIGWLAESVVDGCQGSQDSCFSTHDASFYAQDDIGQSWRSWPYQVNILFLTPPPSSQLTKSKVCTEWGFFQTGSGVPKDQLPLISRTNTLEYQSIICVDAFNITTPPNTDAVNKYGGFAISYPRLAMIDGEQDPWRPSTAHASPFNTTALNRTDTASQPFILIAGAVHHWDEYGLFPNETVNFPPNFLPPLPVRHTQTREVQFVLEWMEEWAEHVKHCHGE